MKRNVVPLQFLGKSSTETQGEVRFHPGTKTAAPTERRQHALNAPIQIASINVKYPHFELLSAEVFGTSEHGSPMREQAR
jgi:hypothetical protein